MPARQPTNSFAFIRDDRSRTGYKLSGPIHAPYAFANPEFSIQPDHPFSLKDFFTFLSDNASSNNLQCVGNQEYQGLVDPSWYSALAEVVEKLPQQYRWAVWFMMPYNGSYLYQTEVGHHYTELHQPDSLERGCKSPISDKLRKKLWKLVETKFLPLIEQDYEHWSTSKWWENTERWPESLRFWWIELSQLAYHTLKRIRYQHYNSRANEHLDTYDFATLSRYVNGIHGDDNIPDNLRTKHIEAFRYTLCRYGSGVLNFYCDYLPNVGNRLKTLLPRLTSVTEMIPHGIVSKSELNSSPLLYGVELELSTDLSVAEIVDVWGDQPFLLAKRDGSITGTKANMYELVTAPASLKAQRINWAKFFGLPQKKFDLTDNTNNGMHVHIHQSAFFKRGYTQNGDWKQLTQSHANTPHRRHINAFTWFFTNPAHYKFLLAFSRRTESSLNNWAAIPKVSKESLGKSAVTRTRTVYNAIEDVKPFRGAVHLSNKGTLEIRIFKGIVDYYFVIRNLEFLEALFNFTYEHFAPTENTLENFTKWVLDTPESKYRALKIHFKRWAKSTDAASLNAPPEDYLAQRAKYASYSTHYIDLAKH